MFPEIIPQPIQAYESAVQALAALLSQKLPVRGRNSCFWGTPIWAKTPGKLLFHKMMQIGGPQKQPFLSASHPHLPLGTKTLPNYFATDLGKVSWAGQFKINSPRLSLWFVDTKTHEIT